MGMQAQATVGAARNAVYVKLESKIHKVEAQLTNLRAIAESTRADAELKAIANLVNAKRVLHEKVAELKRAGENTFDQAKSDIEARVAEFEESVKKIESRIKAA